MDFLWHFLGQKPRLERWEKREISPGVVQGPGPKDNRDNHERVVARENPGPPEEHGPYRRLADAILAYRIFPAGLVSGVLRRQPVQIGDTVGVRYAFFPGLDLFFAARVIDRFDGPSGHLWRTGFTYRTLQGHPKCGAETFCVEKDMTTGQVLVALRSWSRPGTWLARMFSDWVRSLQLQAACAALDNLEQWAKGTHSESTSYKLFTAEIAETAEKNTTLKR
jgi:hypothetical protein